MLPIKPLTDLSYRKAFLNMERRAERHLLDEGLNNIFVPNRVLETLQTRQNQLLFGRRGVGKTHTLKAFLAECVTRGDLAVYLDLTKYGSGLAHEGSAASVGSQFFRSLIIDIADKLYEHLFLKENPTEDAATKQLDLIVNLAAASAPKPGDGHFDYIGITNCFNQIISSLGGGTLYILIDEWAALPPIAQPYFAEFLKRALFSNKHVSLKIAVVDFSHTLSSVVNGVSIGLERSADVFGDVRMDRHFLWDESSAFVEDFFAGVLYSHLAAQLDWDLGIPTREKKAFVLSALFTQEKVLTELCRACEGNARDFLILSNYAHNHFCEHNPKQRDQIGLPDVRVAASQLYRNDKLAAIEKEIHLDRFMQHLVEKIIGERKSRTFMVQYDHRHHPLLKRLYSARILHLLDKEWSHPDRPGERYSIVTIDYGAFVSLKGTRQEVDLTLLHETAHLPAGIDDFVPFDDRRSIRRIVVPHEVLEEFNALAH